MPLRTITWAIARTEIRDSTTWRVLVVMANHADDAGLCWPKTETVADECGRGDRQAREHLERLVDDGYLDRVRVRRSGRLGGYLYRVLAPGNRGVEVDDLPAWAADTEIPGGWESDITSGGPPPVASGGPPPVASGGPPPVDKRRATAGHEPPSTEPPSMNLRGEAEEQQDDSPRPFPTRIDPRRSYVDDIAAWAEDKGLPITGPPDPAGRHRDALRYAVDEFGAVSDQARTRLAWIVAEYVRTIDGQMPAASARGQLHRLIARYGPQTVMRLADQALDYGAGLDPEHADKPRSFVNYMAAIAKREAAEAEAARV